MNSEVGGNFVSYNQDTDSWLSIAGAGCGLTGVGAGEEQERKVVACEASKCGEDK
jgi:hypothetical protein